MFKDLPDVLLFIGIYSGPVITLTALLMDTLCFRLLGMLVILRLALSAPRLKIGSGVFMQVESTSGTPMHGYPIMAEAIPIGIYIVVI